MSKNDGVHDGGNKRNVPAHRSYGESAGRSFADDILPGYQSEEELEALEEQRQKEQRKSFWSSLFGKKKSSIAFTEKATMGEKHVKD